MKLRDLTENIRSAFEYFPSPKDPKFPVDSEAFEVTQGIFDKSWDSLDVSKFEFENLIFAFIPEECISYYFGFCIYCGSANEMNDPESLKILFDRWHVDVVPKLRIEQQTELFTRLLDNHQKEITSEYISAREKVVGLEDNRSARTFQSSVCLARN